MNILFLCTANLHRSVTAERIFAAKHPEHEFRSAGLSQKYCEIYGTTLCTRELLSWADMVFVMESAHKDRIEQYPGKEYLSKIRVLDIPDEFKTMEPKLIEHLRKRVQVHK